MVRNAVAIRTGVRPNRRRASLFFFLVSLNVLGSSSFSLESSFRKDSITTGKATVASSGKELVSEETPFFQVQLNEFFKKPVPPPIRQAVSLFFETNPEKDPDVVTLLTAAPSVPGFPRPLWLVLLGSLPTGLLWFGYYKFAVEEEILHIELEQGGEPRGFGGYGTLGCFSYGMLLGPLAVLLHAPGGIYWSTLGVIFLFYSQYLLYERVNELYLNEGKEAPLETWWCVPFFFPFNFIVGLRQVHFLAQYLFEKRGVNPAPSDPIADALPFIKAERFTWQEFLLTPSLWCVMLAGVENIDKKKLPSIVREILS